MVVDDPSKAAWRIRTALKSFDRRKEAAIAGYHLPTETELMLGMPFFGNDIQQDAQTFSERLLPRIRKKGEHVHFEAVAYALEQLTVSAGRDEVKGLADILSVAAPSLPGGVQSWQLRCRIYLAHLGDHIAALDLARETIRAVLGLEQKPGEWEFAVPMITSALGWLSATLADPAFVAFGDEVRLRLARRPSDLAAHYGWLLTSVIETQALAEAAIQAEARGRRKEEEAAKAPAPVVLEKKADAVGPSSVIVFRQVGNATTGEGKKVAKEFDGLTGTALPLIPVPDLRPLRAALQAEFPYATEVVDRMLLDIAPRSHIRIPPTILVGSPGSGKSRFARRLLRVLDIPHDVIPCGGVSDGSFLGTPRRWSTGEPSLPVALISRHRVAGPGAVLDEIEKAGTSDHNGRAHDALLAFFEIETACRFHDPYIQAPCDVSHISWLMTANKLDGLPAPLRDRCRVIPFPEPGSEHLLVLSRQIIADLLTEQGLDRQWATALDDTELGAISQAWPGGSLRTLRRMIEAALASRSMKH